MNSVHLWGLGPGSIPAGDAETSENRLAASSSTGRCGGRGAVPGWNTGPTRRAHACDAMLPVHRIPHPNARISRRSSGPWRGAAPGRPRHPGGDRDRPGARAPARPGSGRRGRSLEPAEQGCKEKGRRTGVRRPAAGAAAASVRGLDPGRLLALRALDDLELDFLPFFQGLEAVHLDGREMGEKILAPLVRRDEAEAFSIVEPLDGTGCHNRAIRL